MPRLLTALLTLLMLVQMAHAATPASYTGGNNGNWSLATNWSTSPVVPLNAGVNSYDVTINGKTVNFNVSGSSAIQSLTLSGATLKLAAGDNLSILSGITSSTSTLNVQGAAFSTAGTTSVNSTSLLVSASGSISLSGVTSYSTTGASIGGGTFQVDGAASQLLLPNLATISLNNSGLTIKAQNAGDLELGALTSFSGGGSIFEGSTFVATGTNSIVRLNALTALTMNGASITAQAASGGLTELTSLASLNNSGSIFGNFNGFADGTGSKLNLTALTTVTLNGAGDTLRATAGGDLEATALTTITGNNSLTLQATGSGSVLNAPALASASQSHLNVLVQTGGTLNWGHVAILQASAITLDTSGSLDTTFLTNIDSTSLTATNGATLSIPVSAFSATVASATWQASNASSKLQLLAVASVTLAGSDLTVQATAGGDVELPALATLTLGSNTLHLQSSGAGSKVNLPLAPANLSQVAISVSTGGTILWGSPTSLKSSSVTLDTAGTINLAALTNIDASSFNAANGVTLSLPLVTAFATVAGSSATLQASGVNSLLTLPALTSVTNPGDVFSSVTFLANGSGSVVALNALTTVTANASSITFQSQNGGTVQMNALTNTANLGSIFGSISFLADGANSKVNLPLLNTIALNGAANTIRATGGGDVEAPLVGSVSNNGSIFDGLTLTVSDAGSLINVPKLGITPLNRISVSLKGGTITWGNPTVMNASSVTIDTSGSIALTQLVTIDSTGFNAANGVTITLPHVTAIGAVAGSGATLQTSGTGSTLSLPALTSVTNPGDVFSSITFTAGGSGSIVSLPVLTTSTSNAASISFRAQSGGVLQANALNTASNLGSIFGNFNVSADGAGSKVLMTGLTTMHLNGAGNTLSASAGGDLEMPALSAVTGTGNIFESFNANSSGIGSLVNLSGLLSTVPFPDSLSVSNNGELDLGGLHTPFLISFLADFASASSGTLDVYINHVLLTSITPNNDGTFLPYVVPVASTQAGASSVEFIANGTGDSVTLQDYAVTASGASVPEPATLLLMGLLVPALLRRRGPRHG